MKRAAIPWSAPTGSREADQPVRVFAAAAPIAVALVWLLALHGRTAIEMAGIWWRSTTYSHGIVVPPLVLWLVWRKRAALRRHVARPSWGWIAPFAAAGLAWFVGDLVQANAITELALVTLLVTAVPLVAGTRAAREIAFPLGFLYFAVPIGDFLLPQLMQWTADFTVWALQLSGVPVYREGLQFVIPSGRWSVVEACSGVRYLIASLTVGTLYAYLSYRSLWRRWAFVGVAIVVPIVANWLRAYGIVMLGHLSSNRLAVGIDHIIYGWLFFGVVVLAMFAIGARWREEPRPDPAGVPGPPRLAQEARTSQWRAVCAVVVVSSLFPLAEWAIARGTAQPVALAALPAIPGWTPVDAAPSWAPAFRNPSAERLQSFSHGDARVTLYIAYYRDQSPSRKLATSENVLVRPDDPDVLRLREGSRPLDGAGLPDRARLEVIRAGRAQELSTLQWFVVDGHATSSDLRAKAWTAWSRLRGAGDDGAALVLYTDAAHEAALASFAHDAAPALADALARTQAAR